MAQIARRKSLAVNVGGVKVGGSNPIVVQSMTNTDTADVTSTVNQIMALARAGSELVRVTVNTEAAAAAVPKILDTLNCEIPHQSGQRQFTHHDRGRHRIRQAGADRCQLGFARCHQRSEGAQRGVRIKHRPRKSSNQLYDKAYSQWGAEFTIDGLRIRSQTTAGFCSMPSSRTMQHHSAAYDSCRMKSPRRAKISRSGSTNRLYSMRYSFSFR